MAPNTEIRKALVECLISPNECDSNFETANVVDGLFYVGRAIQSVSDSLYALGNNKAATNMGAIENLALQIKEGTGRIAASLDGIASAIRERADHVP